MKNLRFGLMGREVSKANNLKQLSERGSTKVQVNPRIGSSTARLPLVYGSMKSHIWKYAACLVLMVVLGVGEMWGATWTVAASSTDIINGSKTWDPTITSNDLTNVSGYYWALEITGKSPASSSYTFKICQDHAWTTAYPGSDYGFNNVATGSGTTILYTFNSSTHAINAYGFKTWRVVGTTAATGSDWNTSDTGNNMSKGSNVYTYTLTKKNMALSTGTTYKCKIIKDGSYDVSFPASDKTFTVATTGRYDITYSIDLSTQTVSVSTTPSTYTITLDGNGGSGHTSSVTATYNSSTLASITNPTKTGYTFAGWYTGSGGTGSLVINTSGALQANVTNYTGAGGIWVGTEAKTLYAKWTAKTYSITLDDNGDYQGNGSATATYGNTSLAVSSHASRTSWNLVGYWTASGSGGSQVSDASGNLIANVTGYTDSNGKWIKDATCSLYAHWSQTNSLTVAAGAHVGTVTGTTSPVTLGSSYAISASGFDTGYEFYNWTADPAGNGSFASSTSASTNVTVSNGSVTVTANARPTTYTISYSLDGGTNYVGAPTSYTIESSAIVLGTPTKAHYHFAGWTIGGSPITSIPAGSTGNKTLVANWTPLPKVYLKNTMNWATAYVTFYKGEYWDASNGAGSNRSSDRYVADPAAMTYNTSTGLFEYECPDATEFVTKTYRYAAFTKDGQNNYGNFWSTEAIYFNNNFRYDSVAVVAAQTSSLMNSETVRYYTTKTNGNLEYVTLAAGSGTGWFFPGGWSSWETKGNEGEWNSTNIRWTKSLSANTSYEFKIYNQGVYYGNSGTYSASGSKTFTDGGSNCTLSTTLAGTYTFDFNVSTKSLTISYPAVYAVSGSFNSWTEETNLAFTGNDGTYSVTINGSSTNYEFKVLDNAIWYGHANKTFTATESNVTLATGSNNIKLKADVYPNGSYTFAYNKSTHELGVTYPTNYVVTFGKRTGGSTVTAKIDNTTAFNSGTKIKPSTSVTFAQTAATGYTFEGWYNASSGGSKLSSSASYTTTISAATTVYSNYTPNDYAITLDKNTGSANGSVTATYNSTATKSFTAVTKTGYVCTGYWTATSGGYKVVNADGTLASYSSNISAYLNSSGKWIKTTTPTTLYAQWTPATYTITLDKNGGTSNGTATATYDSNKLTSITQPTKTGYHLVDGYYKEAGNTNKISDLSGNLQASTTYTNASSQWSSTSNQTLYAKWAANTYTIAFNANDANYVGTATGTTASIAATYGVSYTLTANGFSRAGYTFNGWNTNADGTSGTNYTNSQTGVSNLTATNGATVTLYAKWTGRTYTVSFNKGAGTCAVSSTTVTFGSPYSAGTGLSGSLPEVTPPSGSVFNGWYDAPTGGNKIDDETLVTTVGDHTLYARFTQRDRVYFYNNLGWSDVYVTYDPRDWSDEYGTGNQGKIYHHMTQIAGTNVWYDDLPEAVLSDWKWFVAFNSTQLGTVGESGTWEWFNSGDAVYRHDFDSYATMFVPESAKTDNWGKNTKASPTTTYYSSSWTYDAAGGGHGENYRQNVGYWMRYNDEKSGYSITGTWDSWANSTSLKAAEQGATTFAVTKVLDANTTYEFLLYKEYTHNTHNHIFTNTTTMTSANCTNIEFTTTNAKYSTLETNHAKITTTVAGEYVFKLTTGTDGTLKMSVEYPMSTNDYRVLYTWNDGSSHTHASEIIKGTASTKDTISVFVHKAADVTSQSLKIQQCTGISGAGVPTWTDRNTISLSSVSKSGVHNFIITKPAAGYATGAYWKEYDGQYYIRTESADGGWDYYLNHTDNIMTRSDYSLTQTLSDPFSHYYCRYIESTSMDITYQIATDYSPCVSEILVGDATIGGAGNTRLPASANVRFSWNEQTNALRRAYLKSAQGDGNTRYLVMHGADNKVRNDDATGTTISANPGQSLAANELLFTDQGNWVYQVSLKVVPGAKVSLIANYNSADRYLVGGADSYETIVGGTGSNLYGITAVYDFKTNRLLTAWTPSGDITEALTDVDLLLLRHGQDGATTITFGVGGSLSAQRVTGAIRFDYDEMFGRVANWETARPLLKYFISFPFDVNVSDVFGLNSAYGDAYIIQRYAGDERAAKGFFRGDGTTTFWEDMPHDGVMKANVGYCVILDNDYFNGNETGAIWQNKSAGSSVYLYFPSAGDVGGITATSKTITVPAQTCTIDRTYTNSGGKTLSHTITDSHWNMMGVPIFNTHTGTATSGTPGAIFVSPEDDAINFRYFYGWNSANNKFSITSAVGYDFKSMHSYMVQYTGNVTFTGGTTPSSVAARRMPLEKNYTIELQALNSNDEMINRTYVELREEACDTFALSEDVYMESNNLAINIYTYAGNYDVAANVLSVGNHVIPVGLDVRKTGTYSLSMPSEFSGTVYLIDQETGERTNLAISDVTVELEKGTYDERFLLEVNVNEEIVTDVQYTTGEGSLKDGKPHKFLQNGILYLLKDGVIYDAQGHLVQ